MLQLSGLWPWALVLVAVNKQPVSFQASFKESYMATFYEFFNEQKYADAVKNVSVASSKAQLPTLSPWPLPGPMSSLN